MIPDESYIPVAAIDTLTDGKGHSFHVRNQEIAVFYLQNRYYAISNVCPHQHVPLLAEGQLEDTVVTCPMHGWQYDVETGKAVHGAGCVTTYPVMVHNGFLYVQIPEDDFLSLW